MSKQILNKSKLQAQTVKQDFPIVGIGASAGGLDAFKKLLAAIPENSGMAYVLVQHLDPTHESILPEILQRVTKVPVLEITDDIPLIPNHIYIIPSNKMLTSIDGVLKLSNREKKVNHSIDVFFKSLAEVHKDCAIGIVLSGTGNDGTLGLKEIKDHGGITIAQNSDSATYDSMPQNAMNAGVVDFVLAPEEIPNQLLQINSIFNFDDSNIGTEDLLKNDEIVFKQILLVLRQRSGVDFTFYKKPTFQRRIARRIAIVKKNNSADYLKFLRSNKDEQDALFMDILIPVTSFFRDPKTYHALAETVFPAILQNKSIGEPIRIWVAGCSTGEEAFSIAICLHEFLGEEFSNIKVQIFASDISDKAIKKARSGVYTALEVEKISEFQRNNYFVKNNGRFEVKKFIRDMCVFAPHNFLKDPPFAKMDLVTCRNVLIYMEPFLQKKAFATFHYALKENGFLLLGKSETTGTSSELFSQVNKNEKIYIRKPLPGRFVQLAPETLQRDFLSSKNLAAERKTPTLGAIGIDFKKSAEAVMISKSPASVVINEQMDIVYIHGNITPFLQAPQGKPTYNLIKMAKEGLAFELRNAIHKSSKEKIPVIKENIPVQINEKESLVCVEIIPLTDTIETHYLVRFEKKLIPTENKEKSSEPNKINDSSIKLKGQKQQLEKELSQTREDMRSITEDMEAFNEELQSANEELQSSNEEMQSLNEELETSKEELQSTNEELIIVNQELLDKQEQLNVSLGEQVQALKQIEASEQRFSNILSQSLMAIAIFKGEDMVVEFANESMLHVLGKGKSILNKPLFDGSPELIGQVFQKLLADVFTTGVPYEGFETKAIIMHNGVLKEIYFNFVYQPYRDVDNSITGITVLATDVTEQVLAKKQIEESVEIAENAKKVADEAKNKAETATKIAEHAVMAKQQFLSNMSHEIRTPMNAIIGFTKVLIKTDLTQKQLEYLEAIKSSGDNLIVLINDILDLAKVDAGKMIFAREPFKIELSINTILHLFETKFKEGNVKLVKKYDNRIPEIVVGDAVRLNQILINLLSNAIKFTSKGTITISVNLINEDTKKVTLELSVSDTGIGIPKDKVKAIFEIFEQATSVTSSLYGGTGLGLAIVKQLVEKQGGKISLKSKINEGSTFSFKLSFLKSNLKELINPQEPQLEYKIKPLKVLIVDDVKINQLLLRAILDDFKFTYDIADNGQMAIEKLEKNTYDVILLDLQMPIMNGYEATDHIRNILKLKTPILVLTADVTTVDINKCISAGMNDYISKPLDIPLLYSKIINLVKKK